MDKWHVVLFTLSTHPTCLLVTDLSTVNVLVVHILLLFSDDHTNGAI